MEGIGKYLIAIVAAACICSVFRYIADKMGASGKIVKMITGIFMLIALIAPLRNVSLPNILNLSEELEADAQRYVLQGQEIANKQLRSYISEHVTSYILEKASSFNLSVEVSVELSDAQIPKPTAVQITGHISPYAKSILSSKIESELGIPEENQKWILSR